MSRNLPSAIYHQNHPFQGRFQGWIVLACLLLIGLSGCEQKTLSALEQVKARGHLLIATRNGPTTYFEGANGPTGFEYELLKGFADSLGVKLKLHTPARFNEIIPMVVDNRVDFAAAGLTVTARRKRTIRFTEPYQTITQQVVYHKDSRRPRRVQDLYNKDLEIVAASSHAERLLHLRNTKYPKLGWKAHTDLDSEELLRLVWLRFIDYTIADSNEVALNRRYYPELRVGFNINKPEPLAWAFAKSTDNSLFDAAQSYIQATRKSGELGRLIERFYGHMQRMSGFSARYFRQHIGERLPALEEYFKQAGKDTKQDWQFLAAIGYQESRWDPKAVSHTGVKGIMMLTLGTARDLGIKNREDPQQSIIGGARYLQIVKKKIPERIKEPDRSWFALAAYNIGYGHLEDARVLCQKQGKSTDLWRDVKQCLPLLSQKRWYNQTRYGYARGSEPVAYVERIRRFHDILRWHLLQQEKERSAPSKNINIKELSLPAL